MDIFAISDWHLSIHNPKPMDIFGGAWENYVEELTENLNSVLHDDSILLIAGDISWAMQLETAQPDLDFIAQFKGKKVILRGNHDYWWKSVSGVRAAVGKDTYVIQNDSVRLGNVVIAGSRGWTQPELGDVENEKIYAREVLRMRMSLEHAAKKQQEGDKLIVMTHYPPFVLGSGVYQTPVTETIKTFAPDAVVYGHVHGKYKRDIKSVVEDIPYYLTSCDVLQNVPLKIE